MAAARVWRRVAAVPLWPELTLAAAVLAVVLLAALAPMPLLVLVTGTAVLSVLVRRPFLLTAALVVLMGSVKVNYYFGFFTLFPEYIVLAAAIGLGFFVWLGQPRWPVERELACLFGAWILAGLLSAPFAMSASKVLARVMLMGMALATLFTVLYTVDTRRRLWRAVALWEVVVTLYAAFGIVQMVGIATGFDTTLHALEGISNPDIYLGVGAPVRRRIGDVFRANSMFNDPNILAGFIAAAMVAMLALRLHHAETGRRGRARAELIALCILVVGLFLTQSRSGALALFAGAAVVFAHRRRSLARPGVWVAVAAAIVAIGGAAVLMGVDPTLLLTRFAGIGDTTDGSNRQHLEVFIYGLQLLARFPLTGVGLGNFGLYYGSERDAWFANMMSHSAPLSAFAESGLPGGIAFVALWGWIVSRVARARAAPADAAGEALRVAMLASLVALLVANLFYDYLMRTFVWVIVGLAIATVRLITPSREARSAM